MYQQWSVHWRTASGPAVTLYRGMVSVFADDRDEAVRRARRELQRVAPEWRDSSIVIERVTTAGEV